MNEISFKLGRPFATKQVTRALEADVTNVADKITGIALRAAWITDIVVESDREILERYRHTIFENVFQNQL